MPFVKTEGPGSPAAGDAVVAVGVDVVGALSLLDAAGVLDGAGVVVAGAGLLVVVGAGAEVFVGVLDPENGSVYCWLPAEPPPARVTAGAASAIAPSTSKQVAIRRAPNTLRV